MARCSPTVWSRQQGDSGAGGPAWTVRATWAFGTIRQVHRAPRHLPPDIAALADLLGRVRARIVFEASDEQRPGALEGPSDAAQVNVPPTRLLLRVEEVAEALAVSRSAVYALIRSGEIPSVKIGRSTRVSLEALRRWIRLR